MNRNDKPLTKKSSRAEVDAFVRKISKIQSVKPSGVRGRLIFAMDATASRQPSWDRASHLQAEMFNETARLGGLDIQLCYFRGYNEFSASAWTSEPQGLLREMTSVTCMAGHTQIEKVLQHAIHETKTAKVDALVYVGDSIEEDIDRIRHQAGQLGLHGVPAFVFQEDEDPITAHVFREIARLSRGVYCAFDASSPRQLRDLLGAVAVYAAGGRKALADFSRRTGGIVRQITHQFDNKD